jgi:hypothetical protein
MKIRNLIIAGICLMLVSVTSYSKDEKVFDESIVALINPNAKCLNKENHFYIPIIDKSSSVESNNNTETDTLDYNPLDPSSNSGNEVNKLSNPCHFGLFYVCIPNFTNVLQNKLIKSFEIKPTFAKRTYDSYVNENFDKMFANNKFENKLTFRLALQINF